MPVTRSMRNKLPATSSRATEEDDSKASKAGTRTRGKKVSKPEAEAVEEKLPSTATRRAASKPNPKTKMPAKRTRKRKTSITEEDDIEGPAPVKTLTLDQLHKQHVTPVMVGFTNCAEIVKNMKKIINPEAEAAQEKEFQELLARKVKAPPVTVIKAKAKSILAKKRARSPSPPPPEPKTPPSKLELPKSFNFAECQPPAQVPANKKINLITNISPPATAKPVASTMIVELKNVKSSSPPKIAPTPTNDLNSTYVISPKKETVTTSYLLNQTVTVEKKEGKLFPGPILPPLASSNVSKNKQTKNKLEEKTKDKQKGLLPQHTSNSAMLLKKPAPILGIPSSGFLKPKNFVPFTSGTQSFAPVPHLSKNPFSKPLRLPPPPQQPTAESELDESFKTATSAGRSFLDSSVMDGHLSSYDITVYEDLDEELNHRKNKTVPTWASDKDALKIALYSMVLYPEYTTYKKIPTGFPKPNKAYKLFPPKPGQMNLI